MILNFYQGFGDIATGYIGGTGNGILTVNGVSATREICLFDANTLALHSRTFSTRTGNYVFIGLNPNKRYLLIGRDFNREYEPAVFDYVTPATDLTVEQQQELWESWQTK